MLIGITGMPGSGKSTFLSFFKEKNISTFNSDEIVRNLYKKKYFLKKIKKIFPDYFNGDIFLKENFSSFVFSSKEKLLQLEEIIHPIVLKKLLNFKEKNKNKISVAEVPLLFEKKLENYFDLIICISKKEEESLKKFSNEKKISLKEAIIIYSHQIPILEKEKKADLVIKNDGTIDDLKNKFLDFLNVIQKRSN